MSVGKIKSKTSHFQYNTLDRWLAGLLGQKTKRLILDFCKRGYGQTGSKAYLPAFLQFLTDYIEIFSKSFFFKGLLNDTIKFDIILRHSTHFALQSAHFSTKLYLKNKNDGKTVQNVSFAVQNVHCAVMLGQI